MTDILFAERKIHEIPKYSSKSLVRLCRTRLDTDDFRFMAYFYGFIDNSSLNDAKWNNIISMAKGANRLPMILNQAYKDKNYKIFLMLYASESNLTYLTKAIEIDSNCINNFTDAEFQNLFDQVFVANPINETSISIINAVSQFNLGATVFSSKLLNNVIANVSSPSSIFDLTDSLVSAIVAKAFVGPNDFVTALKYLDKLPKENIKALHITKLLGKITDINQLDHLLKLDKEVVAEKVSFEYVNKTFFTQIPQKLQTSSQPIKLSMSFLRTVQNLNMPTIHDITKEILPSNEKESLEICSLIENLAESKIDTTSDDSLKYDFDLGRAHPLYGCLSLIFLKKINHILATGSRNELIALYNIVSSKFFKGSIDSITDIARVILKKSFASKKLEILWAVGRFSHVKLNILLHPDSYGVDAVRTAPVAVLSKTTFADVANALDNTFPLIVAKTDYLQSFLIDKSVANLKNAIDNDQLIENEKLPNVFEFLCKESVANFAAVKDLFANLHLQDFLKTGKSEDFDSGLNFFSSLEHFKNLVSTVPIPANPELGSSARKKFMSVVQSSPTVNLLDLISASSRLSFGKTDAERDFIYKNSKQANLINQAEWNNLAAQPFEEEYKDILNLILLERIDASFLATADGKRAVYTAFAKSLEKPNILRELIKSVDIDKQKIGQIIFDDYNKGTIASDKPEKLTALAIFLNAALLDKSENDLKAISFNKFDLEIKKTMISQLKLVLDENTVKLFFEIGKTVPDLDEKDKIIAVTKTNAPCNVLPDDLKVYSKDMYKVHRLRNRYTEALSCLLLAYTVDPTFVSDDFNDDFSVIGNVKDGFAQLSKNNAWMTDFRLHIASLETLLRSLNLYGLISFASGLGKVNLAMDVQLIPATLKRAKEFLDSTSTYSVEDKLRLFETMTNLDVINLRNGPNCDIYAVSVLDELHRLKVDTINGQFVNEIYSKIFKSDANHVCLKKLNEIILSKMHSTRNDAEYCGLIASAIESTLRFSASKLDADLILTPVRKRFIESHCYSGSILLVDMAYIKLLPEADTPDYIRYILEREILANRVSSAVRFALAFPKVHRATVTKLLDWVGNDKKRMLVTMEYMDAVTSNLDAPSTWGRLIHAVSLNVGDHLLVIKAIKLAYEWKGILENSPILNQSQLSQVVAWLAANFPSALIDLIQFKPWFAALESFPDVLDSGVARLDDFIFSDLVETLEEHFLSDLTTRFSNIVVSILSEFKRRVDEKKVISNFASCVDSLINMIHRELKADPNSAKLAKLDSDLLSFFEDEASFDVINAAKPDFLSYISKSIKPVFGIENDFGSLSSETASNDPIGFGGRTFVSITSSNTIEAPSGGDGCPAVVPALSETSLSIEAEPVKKIISVPLKTTFVATPKVVISALPADTDVFVPDPPSFSDPGISLDTSFKSTVSDSSSSTTVVKSKNKTNSTHRTKKTAKKQKHKKKTIFETDLLPTVTDPADDMDMYDDKDALGTNPDYFIDKTGAARKCSSMEHENLSSDLSQLTHFMDPYCLNQIKPNVIAKTIDVVGSRFYDNLEIKIFQNMSKNNLSKFGPNHVANFPSKALENLGLAKSELSPEHPCTLFRDDEQYRRAIIDAERGDKLSVSCLRVAEPKAWLEMVPHYGTKFSDLIQSIDSEAVNDEIFVEIDLSTHAHPVWSIIGNSIHTHSRHPCGKISPELADRLTNFYETVSVQCLLASSLSGYDRLTAVGSVNLLESMRAEHFNRLSLGTLEQLPDSSLAFVTIPILADIQPNYRQIIIRKMLNSGLLEPAKEPLNDEQISYAEIYDEIANEWNKMHV